MRWRAGSTGSGKPSRTHAVRPGPDGSPSRILRVLKLEELAEDLTSLGATGLSASNKDSTTWKCTMGFRSRPTSSSSSRRPFCNIDCSYCYLSDRSEKTTNHPRYRRKRSPGFPPRRTCSSNPPPKPFAGMPANLLSYRSPFMSAHSSCFAENPWNPRRGSTPFKPMPR